jgi:hypothetical protein
LLDEYAPDIWSMNTDRSLLVRATLGKPYAKDLEYENDEYRKLLWLRLHQWIFKKAFERLRTFGDTHTARAGILGATLQRPSVPGTTLLVQERTFGSAVVSLVKKQAKKAMGRQVTPASSPATEAATQPTEATR